MAAKQKATDDAAPPPRKKRGPKVNGHAPDDEMSEADKLKKMARGSAEEKPPIVLQTSAEFVAGFVPPDYLIDGLLQRRFLYSLTGKTGDGKTAVALRIVAHVALGLSVAGREVEKGKVLFLSGENPDDVRTRWVKQCEEMKVDPADMDVVFMPGTQGMSIKEINAEIAGLELGPLSLVAIDTSAAYFGGEEENDNKQLGDHARDMRSLIDLPGGPTVIVTCHPTKTPDPDNLLPRGGGAFIAEVDGNLVAIKDGLVVKVHWHGKFRGPDFSPFQFKLQAGTSDKLKDTKDRFVWTVTATPLAEEEARVMTAATRTREGELMALLKDETNAMLSNPDIATKLGWNLENGNPNRQLVDRLMKGLLAAKLVRDVRGRRTLTKTGLNYGLF